MELCLIVFYVLQRATPSAAASTPELILCSYVGAIVRDLGCVCVREREREREREWGKERDERERKIVSNQLT